MGLTKTMKLTAIDVRNTASAADLIYDVLREAIFNGELADGEHLAQDRLAEMFNSSRIPVREALVRLKQHGLVETERFRGTTVLGLSSTEIEEIFEFRAMIESDLIGHAVSNMSATSLENAKRHCQAFGTETDSSKWGILNRNFHYSLYEHANRPYYLHIVKGTLDRIERYLRAQLTLTDGMSRARREHLGILNACIDRNPDAAAQLTREHILGASLSLISFLNSQETKSTEFKPGAG